VPTAQKRPEVGFVRAHSVEPWIKQNDGDSDDAREKATAAARPSRSQKLTLSRIEIDEIAQKSRRILDAALLPCSKRLVLSIDRELEKDAAKWRAERTARSMPGTGAADSVHDERKRAKRNSTARGTRPEDEADRIVPPALLYDGRAMRAASSCFSMGNEPSALDAACRRDLRRSYPGAMKLETQGLFDLKQDLLLAQKRDPFERFSPVTARARGTYLYGLMGDVVKSHSLVAALPVQSFLDATAEDGNEEEGNVEVLRPQQSDPSRASLKTSGGTDWNSLNKERREERLSRDFGALLVQYKGFVHEITVMNGDWYWQTAQSQRDRLCVEIAQICQWFGKIVREQRPMESNEQARQPLTELEIHEFMKEGLNTQMTNALLEDAKRADAELDEFDVTAFRFSRRADWIAMSNLKQSAQAACERFRLLKLKLRGGNHHSTWKFLKSKIPEVAHSPKFRALPTNSLVAQTLRDSLRDSTLDRDGVGLPKSVLTCHRAESNKVQEHLDQVLTAQMDMKVQRKINDIRTAMQASHVNDASPSAGAFSRLCVCSMPGYRIEKHGLVQRLFESDDPNPARLKA